MCARVVENAFHRESFESNPEGKAQSCSRPVVGKKTCVTSRHESPLNSDIYGEKHLLVANPSFIYGFHTGWEG